MSIVGPAFQIQTLEAERDMLLAKLATAEEQAAKGRRMATLLRVEAVRHRKVVEDLLSVIQNGGEQNV